LLTALSVLLYLILIKEKKRKEKKRKEKKRKEKKGILNKMSHDRFGEGLQTNAHTPASYNSS
jgi:hypothetical protein